jgi:hypothetical protein
MWLFSIQFYIFVNMFLLLAFTAILFTVYVCFFNPEPSKPRPLYIVRRKSEGGIEIVVVDDSDWWDGGKQKQAGCGEGDEQQYAR